MNTAKHHRRCEELLISQDQQGTRVSDQCHDIRSEACRTSPSSELSQLIEDPEVAWKTDNQTWIAEEVKKNVKKYDHSQSQSTLVAENEDDDADSDIEVVMNSWLQRDFVAFKKDSKEYSIEDEFLSGEWNDELKSQKRRKDEDDDAFEQLYDEDNSFEQLYEDKW